MFGFVYNLLTFTLSCSSQSLKHNPNGRFVVVCGDGEYIIYTALAWRNRSFGSALEFVWSSDGEYAVRESSSKIKIFSKNFQVCTILSFRWFLILKDIFLHIKKFVCMHTLFSLVERYVISNRSIASWRAGFNRMNKILGREGISNFKKIFIFKQFDWLFSKCI